MPPKWHQCRNLLIGEKKNKTDRGETVVILNFAVETPNFAVETPDFAVVPETPKI
jgi:hypothetical protein